jgi:hypothetical protein
VIEGATLLNVQENKDDAIATLAVLPQDATILNYMLEAQIPLRLVPHLAGSEGLSEPQVITLPVVNYQPASGDEEITAYIAPPEKFIGDYSALRTDDPAVVIFLIPADTPQTALEGIPLYRLATGQYLLSFEITVQVGTYTINREDGTRETGTSARMLLKVTQAGWIEQLDTLNVDYTYTILPVARQ